MSCTCALDLRAACAVSSAAQILGVNPHHVWAVFNHWVGLALANDDPSAITRLGVDEASSKKGHSYVTIGVDLDTSRVVHASEGKGKQCIANIANLHPTLGQAYRLKELFNDLWAMPDKVSAGIFLHDWCDQVQKAKIPAFDQFAKTVKSHWSGIIHFVESNITNAMFLFNLRYCPISSK